MERGASNEPGGWDEPAVCEGPDSWAGWPVGATASGFMVEWRCSGVVALVNLEKQAGSRVLRSGDAGRLVAAAAGAGPVVEPGFVAVNVPAALSGLPGLGHGGRKVKVGGVGSSRLPAIAWTNVDRREVSQWPPVDLFGSDPTFLLRCYLRDCQCPDPIFWSHRISADRKSCGLCPSLSATPM